MAGARDFIRNRTGKASDRRPLPQRTQAPSRSPGLRHRADHGGKRARFRDRRLRQGDTQGLLDPPCGSAGMGEGTQPRFRRRRPSCSRRCSIPENARTSRHAEELSNIWKARMAELEPRNRRVSRNRPPTHTRLDRERWHLNRRDAANHQSPSALHAVRRAVEHLEERRTVFTANMLRALALATGRWTLPEIDAANRPAARRGSPHRGHRRPVPILPSSRREP